MSVPVPCPRTPNRCETPNYAAAWTNGNITVTYILGAQRIMNWKPERIPSSMPLIREWNFDLLVISKYRVTVLPHFLRTY